MASKISEAKSLPFHQLIGAPLIALIQGQTQAAQATAEFIERIGMQQTEGGSSVLRTLSFGYSKPDETGEMRNYKLQIPLLALVPIPALQIKDSQIDFAVKINDMQMSSVQTPLSTDDDDPGGWLAKDQLQFRTSFAEKSSSQTNSNVQMNMKISIEQAQTPVGVSELLRLFERAVTDQEDDGVDVVIDSDTAAGDDTIESPNAPESSSTTASSEKASSEYASDSSKV